MGIIKPCLYPTPRKETNIRMGLIRNIDNTDFVSKGLIPVPPRSSISSENSHQQRSRFAWMLAVRVQFRGRQANEFIVSLTPIENTE